MMQPLVVASEGPHRRPYREPAAARRTPTRIHYRPGLSIWTLVLVLGVALPLALSARRQLPGQQRTVSCSTLAAPATFRCTAWDRVTGDVRRVPCEEAQRTLGEQLDQSGILAQPIITVVSTVSPVESTPIPTPNVYVGGLNMAMFPRVPRSSANDATVAAAWSKIERPADGSIDPAAARALLGVCAAAPPAETEHRAVALMIVPRDDRAAALILVLGLVALVLLFARNAVVEIDPETSQLRIFERIFVFAKAPLSLSLVDVADVVVALGSKGPLVGRRVEIVLRDGSRIPLVSSFAPIATRPHERVARTLRTVVGSLAR